LRLTGRYTALLSRDLGAPNASVAITTLLIDGGQKFAASA
jgi:hypothetical protein